MVWWFKWLTFWLVFLFTWILRCFCCRVLLKFDLKCWSVCLSPLPNFVRNAAVQVWWLPDVNLPYKEKLQLTHYCFTFTGERVLCFHGPLLYEAKSVKVAIRGKQVKYCTHYSGWNENWDERFPESKGLKYVDTNLQKQWELPKANQEQYAEGKIRGAAPGKDIWSATEKR